MLARSVKSGRKCRGNGLPLSPWRPKWGKGQAPLKRAHGLTHLVGGHALLVCSG